MERHQTYRVGHRLRSVAFLIVERHEIVDRVLAELATSPDLVPCERNEVERAVSYFARHEGNRDGVTPGSQLDLRHLMQLHDGRIVVDYNGSFSGVRSLFDLLARANGTAGKKRASAFEEAVARDMCNVEARAVLWGCGKRIVFADGTAREVDVAIVLDDAMIVCECKSRGLRRVDDVPTPGRIKERWDRLLVGLERVDSLAEKLASVPVVSPAPIPKEVRRIVPCVVTPAVEWVPKRDERLWFAPSLPRFCAAAEASYLVRLIAQGTVLANSVARP
jgi:hypothetical protein